MGANLARSSIGVHVHAAARRGAVYWLLQRLLTYPDATLAGEAHSGELDRLVVQLLGDLPYAPPRLPARDWRPDDAVNLESEFIRLFELPVDGQPCVLYGGVHTGNRQSVMQELLRYYRHFGLSVDGAQDKDLPDSIPTVLEFMQYLCMLESQHANTGASGAPRAAQRDLLARHLVQWCSKISEHIDRMHPARPYANTVSLLEQFCRLELDHLTTT